MWTNSNSWKKYEEPKTNKKNVSWKFVWGKAKEIKIEAWVALLAFILSLYSVYSGEQQSKESDKRNKKQLEFTRESLDVSRQALNQSDSQFKQALNANLRQVQNSESTYRVSKLHFEAISKNNDEQLSLTRKSINLSENQFEKALEANIRQVENSEKSYKLSKQELDTISQHFQEQLKRSQEHEKLSVRPILDFERILSKMGDVIGIKVKNKGLGPATIIEQKVYFDGNLLSDWSEITSKIVEEKLAYWKKLPPTRYETGSSFTMLPKDEKFVYFTQNKNVKNFAKAKESFSRISIEYKYINIYNDSSTVFYEKRLIPHIALVNKPLIKSENDKERLDEQQQQQQQQQ